jgi:hypothetical protein
MKQNKNKKNGGKKKGERSVGNEGRMNECIYKFIKKYQNKYKMLTISCLY